MKWSFQEFVWSDLRLTIATCDGYPNKGNNTVNLPCVDFHSNEIPIRAVIIPFFAGFGIGIGTIECQKMPQFRIRIRIRIRIQHYITAGFGIGIGIKECQKMPQFRIRIRIQHRNYNSSNAHGERGDADYCQRDVIIVQNLCNRGFRSSMRDGYG